MTLSRERLEELNSHLMLFYTGIKRTASEVASSYVAEHGRTRRVADPDARLRGAKLRDSEQRTEIWPRLANCCTKPGWPSAH